MDDVTRKQAVSNTAFELKHWAGQENKRTSNVVLQVSSRLPNTKVASTRTLREAPIKFISNEGETVAAQLDRKLKMFCSSLVKPAKTQMITVFIKPKSCGDLNRKTAYDVNGTFIAKTSSVHFDKAFTNENQNWLKLRNQEIESFRGFQGQKRSNILASFITEVSELSIIPLLGFKRLYSSLNGRSIQETQA